VETEFRFDPAVPFNRVDASSRNGVVTLTGTVSSLRACERATRLAETVRGVRSVINRIGIDQIVEPSAQSLAEAVEGELLYDSATDAYEINVAADDRGEVTLGGTVDSWAERDIAERVAKGARGVVEVNNEIAIAPKQDRPDAEIRPEVKQRLRRDTLVDDELIDVRVLNGEVFLSGTVGSAAEKRRAERDARGSGVDVDVSVEAGVATLSGHVGSWRENTTRPAKTPSRVARSA
jgi:osmotically-inducible protein OsmY